METNFKKFIFSNNHTYEGKFWDIFHRKNKPPFYVQKPLKDKIINHCILDKSRVIYMVEDYFKTFILDKKITIPATPIKDGRKLSNYRLYTFTLKSITLKWGGLHPQLSSSRSPHYIFSDGKNNYKVLPYDTLSCEVWEENKHSDIDPYGEEDWEIGENVMESVNHSDIDPYGEENWVEPNLSPLPSSVRCHYSFDNFIEGEIYKVDGAYGDPQRAIEEFGIDDYMPLECIGRVVLIVNGDRVNIKVEDFLLFFDEAS